MADSVTVKGTVTKINSNGFILDNGVDWLNYSKEEYRGAPFEIPEDGDTVAITLVKDKFIKTCRVVSSAPPSAAPPNAAPSPARRAPSFDSVSPRYLALKLAAERFSFDPASKAVDLKTVVSNVLAVADDFFAYLVQEVGDGTGD